MSPLYPPKSRHTALNKGLLGARQEQAVHARVAPAASLDCGLRDWACPCPAPRAHLLEETGTASGQPAPPIDVGTLNRNPASCRRCHSHRKGLGHPRIFQVASAPPQETMTEARKLPPPLPPRLDWFVHTQVGQLAQDAVPEWFHGAISREEAENLLESQPPGSFLIRVSHSHVGYTLSYKAQSSCCHFMVKLLDDGSFMIPGEKVAHTSLDALVTFHQQKPIEALGELLTQPCRQKDPANVDYKDLFLYSNAVAEEAACQVSAPEEPSPKPVLLHQSEERKPSAEMNRITTEEATSSCPPKAPLGEALWRNLKMLPKTGQRVRQQLKTHLATVNLSSLLDVRKSTVTSGPGTRKGSQEPSGDTTLGDRAYMDPCAATSLENPSEPQTPKDRKIPTRKAERSASCSEVTSGGRSWHQTIVRAVSAQESKPECQGLAEPDDDQLPEEYQQPPPFAPGYC
ncbi:LOW QUALITY PROTEIN: Hematopoietic SH2 domain-containing protein [Plecturocebus cupreus]